jgi:hypothetical protein
VGGAVPLTRTRVRAAPELIALAAYAVLLVVALGAHEMWRDELQAWSIAASSSSLPDLWHRAAYEPDPNLWFVVLFCASRISSSPVVLQVVNFLISVAAAGLVLFRAPLSLGHRLLLVFGYFLLYEYGAISRPYALVVLLAFATVDLLASDRSAIVGPSILLALLLQTSMYAVPLSIPLLVLVGWRIGKQGAITPRLVSALVLLAGLASVANELAMPRDFAFVQDPGHGIRLLIAVANGFMPVVPWRLHFWNAALLPPPVAATLGALLLLGAAASLARFRESLFVFATAAAALLASTYAVSYGAWRQHGLFTIAYVLALWLARTGGGRQSRETFLTIVLLVQLVSSAAAVTIDQRFDFSAAHRTASFLDGMLAADDVVVGYPDLQVSPVAGYLRRPVFYLAGGRFGTYVIWDQRRFVIDTSMLGPLIADAHRRHRRVILVAGAGRQFRGESFVPIASFAPAVVEDETYRVYVAR